MIKVIPVKKSFSKPRGIVVYKRYRIFDYKVLREMPLYLLDEEEFKFVVKTLLESGGKESGGYT